jgi:hypothetical protein
LISTPRKQSALSSIEQRLEEIMGYVENEQWDLIDNKMLNKEIYAPLIEIAKGEINE